MRVQIEQITVEEKTSKAGKPYTSAGLKVAGKWHNGFVGRGDDCIKTWKEGDMVEVILFQEEYNGNMYDKFRIPSETDVLRGLIEGMELRIQKLEGTNAAQFGLPDVKPVTIETTPVVLTEAPLEDLLPF